MRLPWYRHRAAARPAPSLLAQQVTRTVVADRITSGSPPSPHHAAPAFSQAIPPRRLPVFRAHLSPAWFSPSASAASRSDRGGFRPALPAVYHCPSPHSARYTHAIPGGCRRGPSVPSPGQNIVPEPVAFTFSFVTWSAARQRRTHTPSCARRIRLPAHRRPQPSRCQRVICPPGGCISPAVPPHPAGGNAPYARPRT